MPDRGGRPSGSRREQIRATRGLRALVIVFGVLATVMVAFVTFAGLWTDWLWYRAVRYPSVFRTVLGTRVTLFAAFGLLMATAVGFNMHLAYRLRPPLSAMSPEQRGLDHCRSGIAPHRRLLLLGICAFVGLAAGGAASARWRLWLMTVNATPFHVKDPQFHKDVSFYVFDLPWYRFLLNFGFAAVLLSLVAAVAVHYLYGGLRITAPGGRATAAATGHLAVLLGLFVTLKAVAYWLDRYALAVRSSGLGPADHWTGLRYVDANAYLPAKTILCSIAVICAVLFYATLWRRTWSLPVIGFGLMVLSAVLIGGLYPALVQKFQVKPHEAAKEAPFIQRNIDATRAAYGIADSEVSQYPGRSTTPGPTLRRDADATASIRVLDPTKAAPAFQRLKPSRGYYTFPSTLDVDRYTVGGKEQDTVVGVRELDTDAIPDRSWTDEHLTYTHGYGVIAAKGTAVTSADPAGQPVFTGQDPAAAGAFGPYQKDVYFGERTTRFAVVGGPAGEQEAAGAGPVSTGAASGAYHGKGGVDLSDPLTRAAYAVALGEPRLVTSGTIGNGSKILYNRTPKERVAAVAPWLSIDGDPYPVVVGGRVLWVVDAYTTTDDYPYATRSTLGDATRDALTGGGRAVVAREDQVNYIRNSVKATVDAYDGTVTLYQWDTHDPLLRTWMKAFPRTVRPRSAIPRDLMAHLRYPQDLFKVQRQMLATYHVTTAARFSSGDEAWQVPDDPASASGKAVPPYYLSMTMPGQSAPAYSLTTTFTPARQESLASFVAVNADATSPDYGTMRILTIPSAARIDGPRRVQSTFTAARGAFAPELARLKRGGATVEYGNLLTVPLDGGLLYVEPVYVRGADADDTGDPLLQRVLVDFGGRTALGDTLDQALDTVFGAAGPPVAVADASPGASGALRTALDDAQRAFDDGQKAMKSGDWDAYGDAQQRLADALRRARAAEPGAVRGTAAAR